MWLKNIHESWNEFLTEDIRSVLADIEGKVCSCEYNPSEEKVLRFMELDLNNIKVVWKGMDPYPANGVATGRAFEVGGLDSWQKPFKQVSLKNILRLIHKNYTGINDYGDIVSYGELKSLMKSGEFCISEPDEWFDIMERQGVLFLNTYLTVAVGNSNSHKDLWLDFSKKLVEYISTKRPDMVWFLWGKEAQLTKENITRGCIYESRHPMMCSEKYEDDFLKSDCFAKTKHLVNWLS